MRRLAWILLSGWLALPAGSAVAEDAPGIPIRAGQWRIGSRVAVSVAPRPRERESTQCLDKEILRADQLAGRSSACENVDVRIAGDTMTWKIVCRAPLEGHGGEGRVTVKDDSLSGEMKLRGAPREDREPVEVTTTWQGSRLGECQ
jgi:hypothetical protein